MQTKRVKAMYIIILPCVVFVLRWQLSPTQVKWTSSPNDSISILHWFLSKSEVVSTRNLLRCLSQHNQKVPGGIIIIGITLYPSALFSTLLIDSKNRNKTSVNK